MSEEETHDSDELEEDVESIDSPEPVVQPQRTVPLEALESERRKRQDLEAQNKALHELVLKGKEPISKPIEDDEDEEDFITKAELKQRLKSASAEAKRELLEESFCESKPEAIDLINAHLESIIKRKPWLAQTIETAPNRYARAYEIVQDYMPKTEAKGISNPKADAKRIVENSMKPGSPAVIAKSPNLNNVEYMKSMAGKPEFREYRKKMLSGT